METEPVPNEDATPTVDLLEPPPTPEAQLRATNSELQAENTRLYQALQQMEENAQLKFEEWLQNHHIAYTMVTNLNAAQSPTSNTDKEGLLHTALANLELEIAKEQNTNKNLIAETNELRDRVAQAVKDLQQQKAQNKRNPFPYCHVQEHRPLYLFFRTYGETS